MLTDDEFVQAFETASLPASEFNHAAHVRAGWWYLRHHPIGEAIDRFSRALRAFADANGASGKYHETVTYLPDNVAATTQHSVGLQTTYISGSGDFTGAAIEPNDDHPILLLPDWG